MANAQRDLDAAKQHLSNVSAVSDKKGVKTETPSIAYVYPKKGSEHIMSLKITTELTIKPGASQTQEEAEAEFITLFREYLTNREGAFLTDYGPEPWGGYDGPTVTAVAVFDPDEPR